MRKLTVLPPSPLPPLYAAWMDELLKGPIAAETEATCDDCAMCSPAGEDNDGKTFSRESKCCTYLPDVPNFLVGRVLDDRDPAARRGRATIEQRIDAKIAVTPLGLLVPRPYEMLYEHASRHEGFGRTPSLRCPHYIEETGGQCGMWKHRTSVCTTWFCKHVRGAVGRDFWRKGIQPLLAAIETALARFCVLELDPGGEALLRIFRRDNRVGPEATEQGSQLQPDPGVYRRDWGTWHGKERAFYIECARLVSPLGWKDVLRHGGAEVRARARIARDLYAKLSSDLPRVLRAGSFQVVELNAEHTRVSSYSSYDPLDLPNELVPLLARFDGRPTRKVVSAIAKHEGVELDADLLQRLVDFEILVDGDPAARRNT